MTNTKTSGLKPGEKTPASGQFQVIGPRGGKGPEVTGVKGNPFHRPQARKHLHARRSKQEPIGTREIKENAMKFIHHNLGYLQAGEVVEVNLAGNAANVRLLDSVNLSSYKRGRRHRYYGGLVTRSPVRLAIPRSGNWHVAVDMTGLRGTVRSSARLMPGPLPPIKTPPLSSVPSLVRNQQPKVDQADDIFDVFISHASEDKDEVVGPLANALKEEGLRVWYDEFELGIGSSLRQTIDLGIAHSRFGVVVLSNSFFGKGWPAYELDGLVTRTVSGEQVLLPIWHGVTKQQVMDFSPSLADKLARSTASHTVTEIAAEIAAVIQKSLVPDFQDPIEDG